MKNETVEEFQKRGGKIKIIPSALNDEREAIHTSRAINFNWRTVARRIMRHNASGFIRKKKGE